MRWVIGYGSLVCEDSARKTVPGLENFQLCELPGYIRVFGKVHPKCIRLGRVEPYDQEIAALAIRPRKSSRPLTVSAFQIPEAFFKELDKRECDYSKKQVMVHKSDMSGTLTGTVYVGYDNDKSMFKDQCRTREDVYAHWPDFLKIYSGSIYRADIYPSPYYLDYVSDAFCKAGKEVYENFLDTTYLADEATTIRKYLENPSKVKTYAKAYN